MWANIEGNNDAVSAIKHLILDWPMDFVLIPGSSPDEQQENIFKWTVNMSVKADRLRDFIGLENVNLMRIVTVAADIVKAKLVSGRKGNAKIVHTWLVANVRWGTFHCPDVLTVERHVANWAAIQKDAKVLAIIEAALQHYGRNNLLDWPAKLAIVVSKTDALSRPYVVEALYTHVWRANEADPYGVAELKKNVIPEILWARQYMRTINRQHPELPGRRRTLRTNMGLPASRVLESPLAFFMKTEGPERDPTWVQSLPNEAQRCFCKHALEVALGLYQPGIKGGAVFNFCGQI